MRFLRPLGLVLAVLASGMSAGAETRGLRGALKDPATLAGPAPMTVRLGRSAGSPACGLPCAEFIVAEGDIRRDTVSQLAALLRILPRTLPVYLSSPGGSLDGALALGHLMRSHGVEVIVARRALVALRPDVSAYADAIEPARCQSACVYAFAGGAIRRVPMGSDLGVHQFFVARPDDAARRPKETYSRTDVAHVQQTVATLAGYLAGMGIGIDLLALAAATDPSDMRSLSRQELAALRLEQEPAGFAALPVAPSAPPLPQDSAAPRRARAAPDGSSETPFVVLRAESLSRRFGPISSELTLACGDGIDRYRASFAEIVPGRRATGDAVAILGSPGDPATLRPEGVLSRRSALDAAASGALDVEVTSTATAGYPMRLTFAGEEVAAAIDRLDRLCHRSDAQSPSFEAVRMPSRPGGSGVVPRQRP